ncbi:MAG: hypothetical protein S0880_27910 [Actinomycetota bacterium]|nr:hypothetical protein [Actinomycetota bacterium]
MLSTHDRRRRATGRGPEPGPLRRGTDRAIGRVIETAIVAAAAVIGVFAAVQWAAGPEAVSVLTWLLDLLREGARLTFALLDWIRERLAELDLDL